MVVGAASKSRRGPTVHVDYQVHLEEVKPWPPSHNLKNVRSVMIQWENGDRNSGSTGSVSPSLSDSRIGFNESFRLPVALLKDMTVKNGEAFHKNLLEFNFYEPRRDKTVKGQLLGTAVLDLADFGVLREVRSVAIPLNCTRSFRSTSQSVLHLRVQPVEKGRLSTSSKAGLQKQASNGGDVVSALVSEGFSEEAEFASLTDDDVSSHSSLTVESIASLSALNSTDGLTAERENGSGKGLHSQTSKISHAKLTSSDILTNENQKCSSSGSSNVDLSTLNATPGNKPCFSSTISLPGLETNSGKFDSHAQSSILSTADESMPTPTYGMHAEAIVKTTNGIEPKADDGYEDSGEVLNTYDIHGAESKDGNNDEAIEESGKMVGDKECKFGNESSFGGGRIKHARSIRSSTDTIRSNGSVGLGSLSIERKEAKVYPSERRNGTSDGKVLELENRMRILEGELRETAAIEASLYSVVAEHGSSMNKVHAPARRLSRMYIQAVKGNYKSRRANVAQAAASGLVVVAKACGNDVPRLTFWLSNCVVLRAIVTEAFEEQQLPVSDVPFTNKNAGKRIDQSSPKLTWKASASHKKLARKSLPESIDDWEDPWTFASALEKVESWIFSRIIESVWWQTLTPHMQSSAAKVIDKLIDSECKKSLRRASNSGGQEQVNLSLELWKKAFKDACERLCPVRAGGHECGCLPVLAKLIMEQCVTRLDVAMFNAVLRESIDDIPTDPVSDPISEAKVLPIQAGKSSFGAGAQLKNAIGNWSRLLTDLFGMDDDDDDDDDPLEDENSHSDVDNDDKSWKPVSSFKSFHLLKSLSDLMMLPKDMLLNSSIRKEVCPTFSAHLIRTVLDNFVPDEFCPDPIPHSVVEALEAEDPAGEEEGVITSLPCTAPSVAYAPPRVTFLANTTGDFGSQSRLRRCSSMLRKSNTSDDELDELESPLSRIIDNTQASAGPSLQLNEMSSANAFRYGLLREVWLNSE